MCTWANWLTNDLRETQDAVRTCQAVDRIKAKSKGSQIKEWESKPHGCHCISIQINICIQSLSSLITLILYLIMIKYLFPHLLLIPFYTFPWIYTYYLSSLLLIRFFLFNPHVLFHIFISPEIVNKETLSWGESWKVAPLKLSLCLVLQHTLQITEGES